jgi:hypothetical protein
MLQQNKSHQKYFEAYQAIIANYDKKNSVGMGLLGNKLLLEDRLKLALDHMKKNSLEKEFLWDFLPFAISLKEVIEGALHKNSSLLFRKNIVSALEHAINYYQLKESMWPYQKFSFTIEEVLTAALKNCKSN